MLYGASGYVGRLVAQELVTARVRPVLAGPSHQNLAALGVLLGHGLDIALADSRHPQSVLALLQEGDILVSTVGPYSKLGAAAVEAAIVARVTYIDAATEAPFLRRVLLELDQHARDAGVALVPGFGHLFAAGSLAAELALEGLGDADSVDVGYFDTGTGRHRLSQGMRASRGAALLAPHHAWRDGELATVAAGDRLRVFEVGGGAAYGLTSGALEQLTLPRRHPSLAEVEVYLGTRSERTARVNSAVIGRAGRIPGLERAEAWVAALPRNTQGPDAAERARLATSAVAVAGASGRAVRTVQVRGPDAYSVTARLLSWAALRAAAGGISATGALGPVDAFGLAALREAATAAGLSVVYG